MSFFLRPSDFVVKRDIQAGDEDGIKMKEQAILNLGKLLSKHGKAEGITCSVKYKDQIYRLK